MRITITHEGVKFMDLDAETMNVLKALPVERVIVTGETVEKIRKVLDLANQSDEDLVAMRNTIVRDLTQDDDDMDNWTRMSMITCVIDNEKWKRGMAV